MDDEMVMYFANLIVKNQLICNSVDELKEFYKEEDSFVDFLNAIAIISQNEPAFILLSQDIRDSISSVINDHRYSCDKEISEYINNVISYLNSMSALSQDLSDVMTFSYADFHEKLRNARFINLESFLYSLAYDAIVFTALYDDNLDSIDNKDMAICSIDYFVGTYPKFFEDENIKNRAIKVLDTEYKNSRAFSDRRKTIKYIRKNINNIKEK